MLYKINYFSEEIKTLEVTSDAFQHNGFIPFKYGFENENINPPLKVKNIPARAKSLVLIMDDPDWPDRKVLHWSVWNIPPVKEIAENGLSGTAGMNDFRVTLYQGPFPHAATHRYFFRVYALDDILDLEEGAEREQLEKAMSTHVLAYGELIGLYDAGVIG